MVKVSSNFSSGYSSTIYVNNRSQLLSKGKLSEITIIFYAVHISTTPMYDSLALAAKEHIIALVQSPWLPPSTST